MTAERIRIIEEKIYQLEAMRRALGTLLESCRHGTSSACPILEALDQNGAEPKRPKKKRRSP